MLSARGIESDAEFCELTPYFLLGSKCHTYFQGRLLTNVRKAWVELEIFPGFVRLCNLYLGSHLTVIPKLKPLFVGVTSQTYFEVVTVLETDDGHSDCLTQEKQLYWLYSQIVKDPQRKLEFEVTTNCRTILEFYDQFIVINLDFLRNIELLEHL